MTSQGQRFRRRALRRGYKVDEVDGFLDRVEATLSGEESDAPVSAQEVHDVVFRVRFGGYDEWQVDLHLDRVERQLAEREGTGGRPPARDADLGRAGAGRGEPRPGAERATASVRPGDGGRETFAGGRYDGPAGPGPGRELGGYAGRGEDRDRGYGDRDEPGYAPDQTFPGRGLGRHGKAEMTNELRRLPEREEPRYEEPPGAPYGGPARPEPAGPPGGYRDQPGPPPGYGERDPVGPPPGYGEREPVGPPPGYAEREPVGPSPGYAEREPVGPPPGYRGPAGPPAGYGDRDAPARFGERQPAGPPPYGGPDPAGYADRPPASPPPGYPDREPAGPGFGRPARGEPGYGEEPQGGYDRGRPEPGYGAPTAPGGGFGGRPEPGYGGPGPAGPPAGGGFAGGPSAGPPAGLSPEAQRVDALRRGFQPRRFGSGYDPAEVDRLFEGILSALAGRAPMPGSPADLERARFGLVPGGYFEAEVEAALREVSDILRRF